MALLMTAAQVACFANEFFKRLELRHTFLVEVAV
jgi:hypothetical protein